MGTSSEAGPEPGNPPAARGQECWGECLQQQAPIAAAIGLAAGLASALLGAGVAMLPSPVETMLAAVLQHRPGGAALAVVQSAPVSALAYAAQGTAAWWPALLLSVALAACALVAARVTGRVPAGQLGRGLVLVVLAIAARLLLG